MYRESEGQLLVRAARRGKEGQDSSGARLRPPREERGGAGGPARLGGRSGAEGWRVVGEGGGERGTSDGEPHGGLRRQNGRCSGPG